jgi:transcriptional regulator with XRE-family HTH domain
MAHPEPSPIGRLIRHWRQVRHLSQLDLALGARVSARHMSFIETGRSRPSREMLTRLAEVLEVPLRERNTLLGAAGYAHAYRETGLDDPELRQVRRALEFLIEHLEPNPAMVLDRRWNLLMANRATQKLTAFFFGSSLAPGAPNLLRMMFDPAGLRRFIPNWPEVAGAIVNRVHREAAGSDDEETRALLDEILAYPGIPERWSTPDLERPPALLIPLELERDDERLRLFTTITTLGTPQDITLQELRIECFFPIDETSERTLARIVGRE